MSYISLSFNQFIIQTYSSLPHTCVPLWYCRVIQPLDPQHCFCRRSAACARRVLVLLL